MKEITIQVPDGKKAVWAEDGKLTLVDDKPEQKKPVTERIKTFDDAVEELSQRASDGDDRANQLLEDWNECTTDSPDLIAFIQLRIIAAALNEGWEPQFTKGERRWYPWFNLYTKEEIDKMNDCSLVARRSGYNAGTNGGVAYVYAGFASSYAHSNFGFRLAFKTEAIAEYAGKQFIEIWADFVFKPKEENNG